MLGPILALGLKRKEKKKKKKGFFFSSQEKKTNQLNISLKNIRNKAHTRLIFDSVWARK